MTEKKAKEFVDIVVKTLQLHSEQIVKICEVLKDLEERNDRLMQALLRQQSNNIN